MQLIITQLNVNDIFNWMAPENVTAWNFLGHKYGDSWFEDSVVKMRQRYAALWIEKFDQLTGHFTQLRESINKDGILSPISVVTGPWRSWKTGYYVDDQRPFPSDKETWTSPFGGSRLMVAIELGIKTISCVVHDYLYKYEGDNVSQENYRKLFGSQYHFSHSAPHIRSGVFNHHIKQLQLEATKRARKLF